MYAKTVDEPVDRHVAPLVDAINRSSFAAFTRFSCSGHKGRLDMPYISFECRGFAFPGFVLRCLTALNASTYGSAYVELGEQMGSRIRGVIRLLPYAWARTAYDEIQPPRVVELWWSELDALARMVERRTTTPPRAFVRDTARRRMW